MSDLVGRLRTHVAEYYSGRRNIALSGSLTLQQPKERNMAEEMAATAATAVTGARPAVGDKRKVAM